MGREQDRKVERDDGRDGCEGEAAGDGDVTLAVGGEVHGDDLAADPGGFLGALAEDKRGALDLGAGQGDGFAGLGGEEAGDLVLAGDEAVGDAGEDGGAGVRGHAGRGSGPTHTAASMACSTSARDASAAWPTIEPS